VNEGILDDEYAVCVVRLPGDGDPEQGEFEEAGYRILKSIAPAVKDRVLIKPNALQEAARRGLGTNELARIKVYEAVDGVMAPRKAEEVFLGTFELISWAKTHRPELYLKTPSVWKYEKGDGRK